MGNRLFQSDQPKVDKTNEVCRSVRSNVCMLARLIFKFKSVMENHGKTCENIEVMFQGEHFMMLATAADMLTRKGGEQIKYGLKYNYQYILTSAAETIKGKYLMSPVKEHKAVEINYFFDLLSLNKHSIYGDATYHINKSRQERLRLPSRLPDEEELKKLRDFTIRKITEEYNCFDQHEFVVLRNAVCSRLTLCNARRGGEPSRLTTKNWLERKKWMDDNIFHSLNDIEKKVFAEMQLIKLEKATT